MDIVKHLEQAKAQIKVEEEREVAIIRERVIREIQPKFQEIEQLKSEAINKATTDYNSGRNVEIERHNTQLVALQKTFEETKKDVIDNCEKRKTELLNAKLADETYGVTRDCEKAIAKLDAQINELKS